MLDPAPPGDEPRSATGAIAWSDRAVRPMRAAPGPVRFARYAFGPNRLGYCGPDAATELFQQATVGGDLARLRDLAGQFEGAYPYLELIARSSGIQDPLDEDVVEAYWLGGPLLGRVPSRALGSSVEARFRRRLRGDAWRWLAGNVADGALPNHAFHVLEVFPRVGLLRSGDADRVLETIDACRIRWGRVLERDGDALVVDAVRLTMLGGRLELAAPRVERVRAWLDGATLADDVQAGDVISIHWDWACERLDPRRLAMLQASTRHELQIANTTI